MSSPSVKGAEYGWWVESGCVRGVVEVLGDGGQEAVLGSVVNGILDLITRITYNQPQSILSDSFLDIFFEN